MRRMLASIAVLVVAAVAGLFAFTALGVGGSPGAPAAVKTPAPSRHLTPLQRYSETAGQRENAELAAEDPPLDPARFRRPIAAYRRYATGRARLLITDARRLQAAPSRAAWRRAFADFLDLGAVYTTLGDRVSADLSALERGLWGHGRVAPARLVRDAAALPRAIARARVDPLDYALRAHEILEDAQRDYLGGADVPFSGEGVLATASGVTATRAILHTVRGLLAGRDAALPAELTLDQLRGTLSAIRAAHGGRLPTLAGLRRPERERLEGRLGAALERLQLIPEALATQDPTPVPTI